MNAHNIVTNSYSCGIGEQSQNALMMGNENHTIMRTELKKIQALTKDESNVLHGGFVSVDNNNNGTYALWNGNCSDGGGLLWNANCGCDKCSDEEIEIQE